jgi:hypothetical protein
LPPAAMNYNDFEVLLKHFGELGDYFRQELSFRQ